jgi:hypothetical protein
MLEKSRNQTLEFRIKMNEDVGGKWPDIKAFSGRLDTRGRQGRTTRDIDRQPQDLVDDF